MHHNTHLARCSLSLSLRIVTMTIGVSYRRCPNYHQPELLNDSMDKSRPLACNTAFGVIAERELSTLLCATRLLCTLKAQLSLMELCDSVHMLK